MARQLAGVAALARLDLLDRIARFRSTDMALRGYFSHIDPNGVTPFEVMRRMGARYGMASEIIAWNTTSGDAGPVAAVHGGLASIGHREAMLDERHRHAGIGVASDGGKRLYTIVFTD
ncbi:MAG: CAP domain-containing protein [Candidatus Sericytochromatia bacterium]|nr:CAP domain-containing protein [Candidatus Sericytochromatia bacterium]